MDIFEKIGPAIEATADVTNSNEVKKASCHVNNGPNNNSNTNINLDSLLRWYKHQIGKIKYLQSISLINFRPKDFYGVNSELLILLYDPIFKCIA